MFPTPALNELLTDISLNFSMFSLTSLPPWSCTLQRPGVKGHDIKAIENLENQKPVLFLRFDERSAAFGI